MKRPAFQFYPGDWLNDSALRLVSVGARGCWMDMMCLMHQAVPYGHLMVNGKVILPANLARILGSTIEETSGWLHELEDAGVFSRDESGGIYSRRMVRDENVRNARAAGGILGGNPALKKVGGRLTTKVNQKPTPSSSSSTSSSSVEQEQKKGAKAPPLPRPESVSESTWADWLALRKAKKAPVTGTVVKQAVTEAAKAGMSLEDFLQVWCARGSQGLEADWLKPNERARAGPATPAQMGKQMQGMMTLEALKNGLADSGSGNGNPAVALLEPRRLPGR